MKKPGEMSNICSVETEETVQTRYNFKMIKLRCEWQRTRKKDRREEDDGTHLEDRGKHES